MKRWKTSVAAALLGMLAGCGGGGGDGGTAAGVTLEIVGPSSLDAEIYEGQRIPDLVIQGRLVGDLSSLNGKTLYIFATVPDPIFDLHPLLNIGSDGRSGNVQLFGLTAPDVARTYRNAVSLRACLDVDCKTQIALSKSSIPYQITVKSGLKLSTSSVELQSTFGTLPTPVEVGVSLPDDTVSWTIENAESVNLPTWLVKKAPDGRKALVVSAPELNLAHSTSRVTILVRATTASGEILTRVFEAASRVEASSIPYSLERPVVEFTMKEGTAHLSETIRNAILFQSPVAPNVRLVSRTYSPPASAASHPLREQWLYHSHRQLWRLGVQLLQLPLLCPALLQRRLPPCRPIHRHCGVAARA